MGDVCPAGCHGNERRALGDGWRCLFHPVGYTVLTYIPLRPDRRALLDARKRTLPPS